MSENSSLDESRPANDGAGKLSSLKARERTLVSVALLLVIIFGVVDFFEDSGQGQSVLGLIADTAYMGFLAVVLVYLWWVPPTTTRRQNVLLTQEALIRHSDLESWRQKATNLLVGLSQVIDQQFDAWDLTDAEKQVAFLLVKGMSLKEIARIREASERTVRQQATSVYAKSGVAGRAELSAFFLEDLLPPMN